MVRLFFVFLLFALGVHAQEVDSLLRFVRNIHAFNHLYPQEKVYLHFDNNAYFQGDTIWFAAYVVSAETLQPADLSRVLYVELLSEEGELVSTQRLEIKDGRCHGQIALCREMEQRFVQLQERYTYAFYPLNPRTNNYIINLPSGYYEVRAYTRNMLNWGADVCFSRVLPVFDVPTQEGDYSRLTMENHDGTVTELSRKSGWVKRESPKEGERLQVAFYPEGGKAVSGLPCRMAFKVTDAKGNPLVAEGELSFGDELVGRVSTLHDGMGSVSLSSMRQGGELRLRAGKLKGTFRLPPLATEGASVILNDSSRDSLEFAVYLSDSLRQSPLGVSVTCRGRLLSFDVLGNGAVQHFSILRKQLPAGVNQFTLFDSQGRIYAERLFFIHGDSISVASRFVCQFDKSRYAPFSPVTLKVIGGESNPAYCSLSVRDDNYGIQTAYAEGLYNYLLLGSDLRGYIHRPDYYFESDDSHHRAALDLLLLTQGWRRYEWKQLAGVEQFRPTQFVEKGLVLKGQVGHLLHDQDSLDNIRVEFALYPEGKLPQRGYMQLEDDGGFVWEIKPFVGRRLLTLTTHDASYSLSNAGIRIHRYFSPSSRAYQWGELAFSLTHRSNGGQRDDSFTVAGDNLLENVTVHGKRKQMLKFAFFDLQQEREWARDEGRFRDETITVNRYLRERMGFFKYPSLFAYRVHDSEVSKMNADRVGMDRFKEYDPAAKIAVQSLPIGDVDYILVYDDPLAYRYYDWFDEKTVKQMEKTKKRKTLVSVFAYDRAIDVLGHRRTYIDGYSYVADCYYPRYNREMIPGEVDYRRTLYWNPDLRLDEKGEATVTFYNNSVCEKMVVSCEGW